MSQNYSGEKSVKRFAGALAALILAVVGAVVFTQPASAATYVRVYNSPGSDEWIRVYSSVASNVYFYLAPGEDRHTSTYGIPIEDVRVDVDTTGYFSNGVDVDKYRIGHRGHYGPWHCGETGSSNPPNDYTDGIVYDTQKEPC